MILYDMLLGKMSRRQEKIVPRKKKSILVICQELYEKDFNMFFTDNLRFGLFNIHKI